VNIAESLRYLADNVNWLAHQPDAAAAFDELDQVPTLVESAIRQPSWPSWYAGRCDKCGHDMYAYRDDLAVECEQCHLFYDVAERRAYLLDIVRDHLDRPSVIIRALAGLGVEVSRQRIKMWETRGLIIVKAVDLSGRPMYRVGDVIDIVQRLAEHAR
jgi:hypothetical protein